MVATGLQSPCRYAPWQSGCWWLAMLYFAVWVQKCAWFCVLAVEPLSDSGHHPLTQVES